MWQAIRMKGLSQYSATRWLNTSLQSTMLKRTIMSTFSGLKKTHITWCSCNLGPPLVWKVPSGMAAMIAALLDVVHGPDSAAAEQPAALRVGDRVAEVAPMREVILALQGLLQGCGSIQMHDPGVELRIGWRPKAPHHLRLLLQLDQGRGGCRKGVRRRRGHLQPPPQNAHGAKRGIGGRAASRHERTPNGKVIGQREEHAAPAGAAHGGKYPHPRKGRPRQPQFGLEPKWLRMRRMRRRREKGAGG